MLTVKGTSFFNFRTMSDSRGKLTVCEGGIDIPFNVSRLYWTYDVPENTIRGNHAHRESWQVHVCIGGTAIINLDDGKNKQEVQLSDPSIGLMVGPLVWHSFSLKKDSRLIIFAVDRYNEKDYIKNYEEFKKLARG